MSCAQYGHMKCIIRDKATLTGVFLNVMFSSTFIIMSQKLNESVYDIVNGKIVNGNFLLTFFDIFDN